MKEHQLRVTAWEVYKEEDKKEYWYADKFLCSCGDEFNHDKAKEHLKPKPSNDKE